MDPHTTQPIPPAPMCSGVHWWVHGKWPQAPSCWTPGVLEGLLATALPLGPASPTDSWPRSPASSWHQHGGISGDSLEAPQGAGAGLGQEGNPRVCSTSSLSVLGRGTPRGRVGTASMSPTGTPSPAWGSSGQELVMAHLPALTGARGAQGSYWWESGVLGSRDSAGDGFWLPGTSGPPRGSAQPVSAPGPRLHPEPREDK